MVMTFNPVKPGGLANAISRGQSLYSNFAKNQVLPDQLQAQLQARKLANDTMAIKNNILPQSLNAQLSQQLLANEAAKIKNKNLPATLAAQLAEMGANTQQIKTKTGLMPMTAAIAAMNADTRQAAVDNSRSRFLSPLYNLSKFRDDPNLQTAIAQNPAAAKQYMDAMMGLLNSSAEEYKQQPAQQPTTLADYLGAMKGGKINVDALKSMYKTTQPQAAPAETESQPVQLSPQTLQDAQNATGLKLLKNTTDSQTRMKNLYATNIDKTMDMINVDALTDFSGPEGAIALARYNTDAARGIDTPPKYQAYRNAIQVQLPRLASQIRQFYGDSVQPGNLKKLLNEVNPNRLMNDPKTALRVYNSLRNVMGSEINTWRAAIESPAVYKGEGKGAQNIIEAPTFKNKQDFQQWFKALSPDAQKTYIAQLKKGASK